MRLSAAVQGHRGAVQGVWANEPWSRSSVRQTPSPESSLGHSAKECLLHCPGGPSDSSSAQSSSQRRWTIPSYMHSQGTLPYWLATSTMLCLPKLKLPRF